jgi:hypothetical protein
MSHKPNNTESRAEAFSLRDILIYDASFDDVRQFFLSMMPNANVDRQVDRLADKLSNEALIDPNIEGPQLALAALAICISCIESVAPYVDQAARAMESQERRASKKAVQKCEAAIDDSEKDHS